MRRCEVRSDGSSSTSSAAKAPIMYPREMRQLAKFIRSLSPARACLHRRAKYFSDSFMAADYANRLRPYEIKFHFGFSITKVLLNRLKHQHFFSFLLSNKIRKFTVVDVTRTDQHASHVAARKSSFSINISSRNFSAEGKLAHPQP